MSDRKSPTKLQITWHSETERKTDGTICCTQKILGAPRPLRCGASNVASTDAVALPIATLHCALRPAPMCLVHAARARFRGHCRRPRVHRVDSVPALHLLRATQTQSPCKSPSSGRPSLAVDGPLQCPAR